MPSNLFGQRGPVIPHLAQGSGMKGEIGDLRRDVEAAFKMQQDNGGYIHTEEFINLVAADVDGIKLAAATAATIQAFVRATDWSGVLGQGEMVPPRNVVIATSSHANVDAVVVAIVGRVRDADGKLIAQTDNITLTDGGGVTDAGTKAFAFVDAVTIPAQGGASATLSIGWGVLVGLSRKIRTLAGLTRATREITDGAVVTNGTFATTAPNGTWAPNTAADAAHDYAISYIVAP